MARQHHHLARCCCQLQALAALNAQHCGHSADANVAVCAVDNARQPVQGNRNKHSTMVSGEKSFGLVEIA